MVFSQTSQKTRSILKVVNVNRLKREKNQQVNGLNGVISVVDQVEASCSHQPTTPNISMEDLLKTEPEEFQTMFQSDCEFFQDLGLWCSTPAKEEQPQIIDSIISTKKTHNTNTQTQSSSNARDGLNAKSPTAHVGLSFYNNVTPNDPLSPIDGLLNCDTKFCYPDLGSDNIKANFQEQFLDITDLPVVIEDLESEIPIPSTMEPDYLNTHNTDYTKIYTLTQNKTPFIDQDDSLDMKLSTTVVPRELEWNDVVISEYVINEGVTTAAGVESRRGATGLTLDVVARPPVSNTDLNISTPDVLSFVEQLEKENSAAINMHQPNVWTSVEDSPVASIQDSYNNSPATHVEYEPVTPKTESHLESDDDIKSIASRKRRRNSEDSDETYTPYTEVTPTKKTRRRKPNVPIKVMIQALEESQPVAKARRGRPPKRRDSTVSSTCSVDNGATPTEYKYREIRDKNNEASKRSRMNRKLKELQMVQMALDLEERNKKLKVRADVLEDMAKRMKNALMSAILKQ